MRETVAFIGMVCLALFALGGAVQAVDCPDYDYYLSPSVAYQTHSGSLSAGTHYTYYVYMYQGATYRFTMCEGGGAYNNYDTIIEVLDSSCAQVGYNDDYCGVGSQVDYTCAATGSYYVMVRDFGNDQAINWTLAYRITSEYCYSACESYDYYISPNASYQTHGSVSFGAGGCRTYEAYLRAGVSYRFTVCEGGGSYSADTYFTLYDSSCTYAASNDDYCSVGSQLDFTPSTTDYYYLQVRGYSWRPVDYTLAYRVTSETCPTCPSADYDLSNYIYSYYNTHGSVTVNVGGCRMYSAYLYADTTYTFTLCEGGGSYSGDTYLTLFDSTCSIVASNDDYCSVGSQIDYTPTSDGNYYLQVRHYAWGGPISYTLAYKGQGSCTVCPSYDYYLYPYGDYSTLSSTFGPGDCDMYYVYMWAGTSYRFTVCEGGGAYIYDTYMTLYDSSCAQVAYNDDYCGTGSQLDYTCTTTGAYYLKMTDFGENGPQEYTLAYRFFPDTCTACPSYDHYIYPSSTYSTHTSSLGAGGCKVYEVYLQGATAYTFTFCEGGGTADGDTILTLYDASCTEVAYNDDYCGLLSQIDYTPTTRGYYYLQVNRYSDTAPVTWTLAYKYTPDTCAACPGTSGTLTPSTMYQTLTGNHGVQGCDRYAVSMTAGYTYRFTYCEGGGTANYDTYILLFDSACSEVGGNDDYCGLQSQIDYVCPATGTYYIELNSCCIGNGGGYYTLAYNHTPPSATATPTATVPPTVTSTPTSVPNTPTPTATIEPTATDTPSVTPTPEAIPATGSVGTLVLIALIGLLLVRARRR